MYAFFLMFSSDQGFKNEVVSFNIFFKQVNTFSFAKQLVQVTKRTRRRRRKQCSVFFFSDEQIITQKWSVEKENGTKLRDLGIFLGTKLDFKKAHHCCRTSLRGPFQKEKKMIVYHVQIYLIVYVVILSESWNWMSYTLNIICCMR